MRLFLSPFLNSVGFKKVAGVLASLNVEGVPGIKRPFHNNQATLTHDIIRITKTIIKEAQEDEIKATILKGLEKMG